MYLHVISVYVISIYLCICIYIYVWESLCSQYKFLLNKTHTVNGNIDEFERGEYDGMTLKSKFYTAVEMFECI